MSFKVPTPRRRGHGLKARLYFIISFLGFLPVLGVALALAAIHISRHDGAALDRAARGTIQLERLNGLVYAIVMESRGIYMSPNWTAAEPFATNLMHQLDALTDVARALRVDAITSQQSNAADLSERIDQFVNFRTELTRLARDEGTPAAREFGDNDANRTVRAALNESLRTVAHAHEQEIVRARAQVELDQRDFLVILFVLAGIGVTALVGGLIFVRVGLLAPVLRVKEAMLRLARGDLHIEPNDRRDTDEIGEMVLALNVFQETLTERHKLNRESRLLSELSEWLQSCNSLTELYDMVIEFLGKLLPGCGGSLYVYANSRDILECVQAWNGGLTTPAMQPDDCWGLRRGRPYTFGESEIGFRCAHVDPSASGSYCCVPVLAHGDTIGLLHLEFGREGASERSDISKEALNEQRRLGLICAEQISLAIANVKLRDQLRDQSIRDALTGLFNRRYMLETARREFSRAARTGQSISILSIDVDHFKKFNDNHGHDAGDTVLRSVGGCLEATFRNEDVPCRFGGEEFVVILPGADVDAAARRAEYFRGRVEALVVRYLDRNLPRITVSIGVAAFPESGDNPQLVLKAADEAMYRAKAGGRNRIERSGTAESDCPAGPSLEMALILSGSDYITDEDPDRLATSSA
jgi:diguanylate cyclase (GGDEF)-like protein